MTLFSRFVFGGSLLLAAGLFSGCGSMKEDPDFSSSPTPPASVSSSPAPAGGNAVGADPSLVARLQVGDTITVTLSGILDPIEPHIEAIKEDGTISMPLIGHVQAAGKTAGEVQNTIESLYVPKYYTHVNVAVTTGDRVYYVKGEVKTPGRELYVGQTTVTMAITSAGDFTDFANRKNVWLFHGGKKTKVNCEDIFKHPEKDPTVYPGDVIDVRRRRI
jgi:polysaccharide export outer membrane protein